MSESLSLEKAEKEAEITLNCRRLKESRKLGEDTLSRMFERRMNGALDEWKDIDRAYQRVNEGVIGEVVELQDYGNAA